MFWYVFSLALQIQSLQPSFAFEVQEVVCSECYGEGVKFEVIRIGPLIQLTASAMRLGAGTARGNTRRLCVR